MKTKTAHKSKVIKKSSFDQSLIHLGIHYSSKAQTTEKKSTN